MKNLRKILSLVLVLAVMVCGLTLITASADESAAPEIQQNLWYGETIQIMYRVPTGSAAVQYRIKGDAQWKNAVKSNTVTYEGYDVYLSDGVPAQRIDTIFEVKLADEAEARKTYSVLEYLMERLYVDGIGEATEGENFDKKNMYESLITFAGYAQKVLLEDGTYTAIGDYGYVTVEGGAGTGIYAGSVTLTPNFTVDDDQKIVAKINGTTYDLTDGSYILSVAKSAYYTVVFEAVDKEAESAVVTEHLIMANLNGTTYYFNGTVSGGELQVTTNIAEAAIVCVEETADGYYIYVKDVAENNYLYVKSSGTSGASLVDKESASVFTLHKSGTYICTVGNRGFGMQTTMSTVVFKTYASSNITASNYVFASFETASGDCLVNGHDFGDYISNNDATCTADGTKTAKCSRCDATSTVTEEGTKLDHTPNETPTVNDDQHWTACSECNEVIGEKVDHDFSNGKCVCGYTESTGGDAPAEPTTITKQMVSYGWTNQQQVTSFDLDANISVSCSSGTNTGKYYNTGLGWRIYQSESGKVKITAENGKTIISVKITYTVDKGGCLTYAGSKIATDTIVEVNAASITFGVGNTGSATNGHVRISAIEVVYQ